MSTIEFARKYRPTQLEEVVGQKRTSATLKQASLSNGFAQSYLFSGVRGVGKTTMARVLATLMTCENLKDGKVCGKCRACQGIHTGSSMDVKEIDGASNNGVDEARQLISSARYSPQELKRKVYIIDESHMLTTQANNALLKIVEEPPPYLSFIFCTTEPRKMLGTIISRCQRFNFSKIPSMDIAKRLKFISEKEGIEIEDKALFVLAKMARGSLRDGVVFLQQVGTVAAGKSLTEDNVQKYFGSVDRAGILNLLKCMISGNYPLIMDQVNDLMVACADCKEIMFEVSESFRNMQMIKIQGEKTKLVDLPDYEIQELKRISDGLDLNRIVKLAHLFSELAKKLEYHINERWIMEATLIACTKSLENNS